VSLQDASIGAVQPGEQNQIVFRRHPMQGRSECGVDLQESFRRSLKGLVGRIANVAEA
jgi:hypothetical protein